MVARVGKGSRYARAIFDIGQESGSSDRWLADLDLLSGLSRDPEIGVFLADPKVSVERKKSLLLGGLQGKVSDQAANLVGLLVHGGRVGLLGPIAVEHEKLVNAEKGIALAEVTTAVPMDERLQSSVTRALEGVTAKHIVLRMSVDPAIMGGFKARIGDRMLDGSLLSKIKQLENAIG